MRSKPRWSGALALALALAFGAAGKLTGQESQGAVWFPRQPQFASPVADPHAPRFGGAFVVTDIARPEAGVNPLERGPYDVNKPSSQELMAIVNLGGSYPIYRGPWENGTLEVAGEVGMDTRFRMKLPQKDMFSADWMVAGAVSSMQGPWGWRVRAVHRSSHMGDQFLQATGAHRIQLGNDGLDLYGSRQLGPLRAYAGGEFIAYTETDPIVIAPGQGDRWQAQAGMDADWRPSPSRPDWSLVGGIDLQSAQRTDWKPSVAAEAGLRFNHGDRSARLVLRGFTGASEVYQFFRTTEHFFGLELVVMP